MSDLFQLTRIDPVTGLAEPIPAKERVDALLSHPQASQLVRTMDPQALYSLIHEAGVNDAYELVWMASGDQVQAMVDFDCWTRDTLDMERFADWLDLLLQRDDDGFSEMMEAMDPETIVIWLREHVQVFFWEEDVDLLDMIDAPVMTSPDGVYAIVVPEEESIGATLRLLLDRMYAHDLVMGHRYLEATRWELTSDMAERAFMLREARLGDLGFVPFHEAMEVYAWLVPQQWVAQTRARATAADAPLMVIAEGGRLPPVDHQVQWLEQQQVADGGSRFMRAMGKLAEVVPPESLEPLAESLLSQFRALVNRVHVADLGNPGDMAAARNAGERAERALGLGLELAAGDDDRLAARVLATTPLREIHRAGHASTLELQRQAKRLLDRGNLTLTDAPTSLLSADDQELFAGLMLLRPKRSATYGTPFLTMGDIRDAARRISEVAFVELVFFGLLKHRRDEVIAYTYDAERSVTPVEQITFRSLFATLALRVLAGLPIELGAIAPSELEHVRRALPGSDEDAHAALMDAVLSTMQGAAQAPDLSGIATAYAARIAGWLLDEWGPRDVAVHAAIATTLVLLAPNATKRAT